MTLVTFPAFEKKFSSIYISIKNIFMALKLIYLALLSQTIYMLTQETKNEKKKFIKSSVVWLSQEYQEKNLAKHLGNLQIWTTTKIYKTIHIFR